MSYLHKEFVFDFFNRLLLLITVCYYSYSCYYYVVLRILKGCSVLLSEIVALCCILFCFFLYVVFFVLSLRGNKDNSENMPVFEMSLNIIYPLIL